MKAFARMGLEMRRKVAELLHSEALQRKYLQEAIRRQTETSLALQAAETANAAKADFIANMSHEVRTPMNAIVGYADMLLRTPLQADQQAYAQRLQSASTALLGVMNNVLDFSKIEAGQLQPSTEPFDVIATLDSVMSLFQPQLRGGAVRLQLDLAPDVPRLISADGLRLHQVLVNLVGNAVKFTEEGEVRIAVHARHAPPAAPTLCVRVSDTGIGIEASQIERIFAPFAQADGSITRRFGGTGLGLSISRRLAELMGGTLSVRSQSGQGAEFTLEVPFSPVDQVAGEAGPQNPPEPLLEPTAPAPGPAPALRFADLAVLEPLLQELDGLLSVNMLTARRVAEQVRAELQGTAWAGDFSEVEQEIGRLRFRAARTHLATLRARWADASSGPAPAPSP
jgi:signal transduction histidine kinase